MRLADQVINSHRSARAELDDAGCLRVEPLDDPVAQILYIDEIAGLRAVPVNDHRLRLQDALEKGGDDAALEMTLSLWKERGP